MYTQCTGGRAILAAVGVIPPDVLLAPSTVYSHVLRDISSRSRRVATNIPLPVTSKPIRMGTGRALPVALRAASFQVRDSLTTSSPNIIPAAHLLVTYGSAKGGIAAKLFWEGSFPTMLTPLSYDQLHNHKTIGIGTRLSREGSFPSC